MSAQKQSGRLRQITVAAAVTIFAATGCSPAEDETTAAAGPVEETPITLRDVMLDIGESTKLVAGGIWAEDYAMIRSAAAAIADHPRPNEEQRAAIMGELAEEVGNFVTGDQLVHQLALALQTMADEEAPLDQILGGLHALEAGCLSCHEQFRSRLISAGVTSGGRTTAP
jgi:hypothetical protein